MIGRMKYRTLGSTGLKVSVIGIGTWQFGGEWNKTFSQDEVDGMFARGNELGLNLIDTAECYGDHLSESLIGKAIEKTRSDWIVATKFGHHYDGFMNRSEPRSPDDVLEQLHGSLKALRTDYIDLYQYHSWGDEFFDDDVLAVLHKMQSQGKVRHLGVSISPNSNVKQVEACKARGLEFVQVVYNRLDRVPESGVFDIAIRDKLGILARVPLASGYLSGKYKPGTTFATEDVRSRHNADDVAKKLKEVEQIAKTEVPAGVPMAQWALAWCLKHPAVTAVIPGCKDIAQVESNAAAAEYVD